MQELPRGLGFIPAPLPLAGALGDEHPELTWPWLGRVPRDKAVTAATSPRAGSPRGLEVVWGGAGIPRDRCGFSFQAALAFLKPDEQEEEPLAEADPWDSAGCLLPGAQGSRG